MRFPLPTRPAGFWPAAFAAPLVAACLWPLGTLAQATAGGTGAAESRHERIVSIGGAITEILYALGEDERIVAVDTTSRYPAEALAQKPDTGYLRRLSAEGVLSLAPDLVLMEEGAGPPEAVEMIDAAGIAVRHVPAGESVESLKDKIRIVADAVERTDEGAAMADRIDVQFAALDAELSTIRDRKRVLFILSMSDGRPNAAGRNTAADAVIALSGGTNVLDDVEGYKVLSTEAATALSPDVIVTVSGAGPGGADPLSVPALAATPAGRTGALVTMDALRLLGFGPRTPAAVRDLASRLYPDRVAGTDKTP
ncbi:ABC transporter substrate-binding protein [Fulvimarina sp. 2208YS6-2-32]|uniref:ABC transporter substrate-binding protein n=1 Tax=Fulvimarina uroteuthidis TaxID=3098149 RepID=A0ABU5I5I8_9HYPH|nr:ABC transporter substrate-binding protein [Fulvimarina sp. 2208YS6-2-32]MDY8110178.1 ABC transporter substrate-binding protein [Fulvimarina sp. 2208YS6-2-32]